MKKIINFTKNNVLLILTSFLLAFIPLYPKIPLLDIKNTWVYIRVEDFVVLFVLFFWVSLLLRKKVTLKTPLTVSILFFWIIGAIATVHGIVLFFPGLADVFPNVAFLTFIRHLEYMSLFFVAFSAIRSKKSIDTVIVVLLSTLLAVFLYGMGQRYFGFPAYLTMNEEFAKGLAIQLSSLSRVPSTFAGHYDLAAYLVLMIPIVVSLVFGIKNWFGKIALSVLSLMGVALLFMTVSRVSVFVLVIALLIVFLFQKKKILIYSFPLLLVVGFAFFVFQPSLLARFGNTVREIDVLVDVKTGDAIGQVRFVDTAPYLKGKILKQTRVRDKEQVDQVLTGDISKLEIPQEEASGTAKKKPLKFPSKIPLVVATNVSTGENLPQGTGYINLSLSPVVQRLGNFYYELAPNLSTTTSAEVIVLHGDFLVKKASAYDLSFTTRFQGEWPHAIDNFERNVFLGSGYGSVSLAVDNNYLRILGETGLFGLASFFGIFLVAGVYISRVLPDVDSKKTKSFVLGFVAGVFGLALNATLIDVFEASKIAFVLWILLGVVLGTLSLYAKQNINIYAELKKIALSSWAFASYLTLLAVAIFSQMISNYFVGDDFTWFRWAADCTGTTCLPTLDKVLRFFTESGGFFYRPGAKIYFTMMYSTFWLNQLVYHIISIGLHLLVAVLFFLLAKKIFKSNVYAGLASVLFLIMSGAYEAVFWISATGYLFNAVFALLAILLFALWLERKRNIYYALSIIFVILGMFFHEMGIITPFLMILYKFIKDDNFSFTNTFNKISYSFILAPIPIYIIFRFLSNSHWSGGDYSYNLLKLPLNLVGNTLGYLLLTLTGPISLSVYEGIRSYARQNLPLSVVVSIVALTFLIVIFRFVKKRMSIGDKKIVYFGVLFFMISLLPFLGLGNIASRYSYLASLGVIIILVFIIKKLYEYLKLYGKDISYMALSVVLLVFALFHIIQVQEIHSDWDTAGKKIKNFFVAIDEAYSDSWKTRPTNLYFVNVPVKSGNAWVFPVGLEDALWFAFRSENINVFVEQDLNTALKNAGDSLSDIVYKFNDDGSVSEVVRLKNGVPINILRDQL